MKYIYIIILLLLTNSVNGQTIKLETLDSCTCTCYYDTTLNKYIYTNYDIIPQYAKEKNIMHITRKIQIPNSRYNAEGEYINIHSLSLSVIIDSDGRMLSFNIKNKNEKYYDPFERLVIETIKREYDNEIIWIAGQCSGKDVATRFFVPLIF